MLRAFFSVFAFLIVLVLIWAGFRGQKFTQRPIEIFPDMDHQPKVKAQVPSQFFADGRASREPVPGTLPLGYQMPYGNVEPNILNPGPYREIVFTGIEDYYTTGKMGKNWGTGMPIEVTPELMKRGQERYTITCAVCHGATGAGNGVASKYNWGSIANLQLQRIVDMADGEIFNTITHGKNTMMAYGANIQVPDRWAIIAYLRALQRAQRGTLADVPEADRAKLQQQP